MAEGNYCIFIEHIISRLSGRFLPENVFGDKQFEDLVYAT